MLRKIKGRRVINRIKPGNSLVQPRHGAECITIYRCLQILHSSIKDTGNDKPAPSSCKNSETET